MTSPDGCNWSALSGDSWIAVSSGASANGNGSVSFIVDANSTTQSRSGKIRLEDEVLAITRSRADCSFSLSFANVSFDSEGMEVVRFLSRWLPIPIPSPDPAVSGLKTR